MSASRLWRTLIRIESVEEDSLTVVVTGWNSRQTVSLPKSSVPTQILDLAKPGKRIHAQVNIGADRESDLVFEDWETE